MYIRSLFRAQEYITHTYRGSIIDADRDTRNTLAYSVAHCEKISRFYRQKHTRRPPSSSYYAAASSNLKWRFFAVMTRTSGMCLVCL